MVIRWISAFFDVPADGFEAGVAYWLRATGSVRSDPWGSHGEFATLVPGHGDPHVYLQRLGEGACGNYPDLHVDDLDEATRRALELGAATVRETPGLVVLESPGGLPFCFVRHRQGQSATPAPVRWPGGHRSRLDQICVDVPPGAFDDEVAFWRGLTGWRRSGTDVHEFRRLLPPPGLPLHFLLQRLDTAGESGRASAHMDFSSSDVEAETERHVGLGAEPVRRHPHWQVMRDPVGTAYCITDKDPDGAWLADA
jgi:hypothetical protein